VCAEIWGDLNITFYSLLHDDTNVTFIHSVLIPMHTQSITPKIRDRERIYNTFCSTPPCILLTGLATHVVYHPHGEKDTKVNDYTRREK
jgi:hypothetical protein